MKYLHTMIRVTDPEATIRFFNLIGLTETRRIENEKGRFTLISLAADEDREAALARSAPEVELGSGALFRRAELWPSGLRGGRHLCHLRAFAGAGHCHQPTTTRWTHGFRAYARPDFHRAIAERRTPAAAGTVAVDGKYRYLVSVHAAVVTDGGGQQAHTHD